MVTMKVYGLGRSGTNYLRILLELNYDIKVMHSGKHDHYNQKEATHILCIIKNPYAWLRSVCSYQWPLIPGVRIRFKIWLKEPFFVPNTGVSDLSNVVRETRAANPVQHWNNINWHYASMTSESHVIGVVKYEDLLVNAEKILDKFAENVEALKKPDKFYLCDKRIVLSTKTHGFSGKFEKFDYYVKREYEKDFTKEEISWINSQLDSDLMQRLEYPYFGAE